MRWLSVPFVFWLAVGSSFAQDLDQLRSRATDHWKKRAAGDRKAAAEYIERQERERFLDLYEPQIKTATIDSFRFSGNAREVFVVVKAKIELPIGVFDKTIAERWVWNSGWFLSVGPLAVANPFADQPGVNEGPTLPTFDLLDSEVNLERHVQGEQIPLSVRFKARRSEVASIRALGIPGITTKGITWENPDGGRIDAVLDTSLISADISQPLTFALISTSGGHVSKAVKVSAAIEGRVRIKQIPEIIDPAVSSQLEVEVTNVSKAPIKLAGVGSYNSAYSVVDVQTPLEIKPGESRRLQINHEAQRIPDAAALLLDFADNLFPQAIAFPFAIKMPEDKGFDPASIDPAVLQQILSQQGIRR